LSDGDVGKIALWLARFKGEENILRQLVKLDFLYNIADTEVKNDEED